jgi:UDP-glucose 6-dehydrogenase
MDVHTQSKKNRLPLSPSGSRNGGSCFPKDLAAFIKFSESLGYDPILFKSTQLANDQQLSVVIDMV